MVTPVGGECKVVTDFERMTKYISKRSEVLIAYPTFQAKLTVTLKTRLQSNRVDGNRTDRLIFHQQLVAFWQWSWHYKVFFREKNNKCWYFFSKYPLKNLLFTMTKSWQQGWRLKLSASDMPNNASKYILLQKINNYLSLKSRNDYVIWLK